MKQLKIQVIECQDLQKSDCFSQLADPYVKVSVNSLVRQTTVKKRTLNPVWNEPLFFPINVSDYSNRYEYSHYTEGRRTEWSDYSDYSEYSRRDDRIERRPRPLRSRYDDYYRSRYDGIRIEIKVFDWDRLKEDDFLGSVTYFYTPFTRERDVWLDLSVKGKIHLSIEEIVPIQSRYSDFQSGQDRVAIRSFMDNKDNSDNLIKTQYDFDPNYLGSNVDYKSFSQLRRRPPDDEGERDDTDKSDHKTSYYAHLWGFDITYPVEPSVP